ncbi:MAG: serine hydrolase domain-containing protein [Actinomycetota bacterium]
MNKDIVNKDMMNDDVFPGGDWETAEPDSSVDVARVDASLDALFGVRDQPPGTSLATVVVHRGRIVRERYGHQPDTAFGPGGPVDRDTTLISWSMAKSITHAVVGTLVDEGRLELDTPVNVPEWRGSPRAAITLRDLLRMRDGLAFVEDYVLDESGNVVSDVIAMLFGAGADDVAAYARSRPSSQAPGSSWSYSSGTTNIVCSLIGDVVGGREAVEALLHDRLFAPLGMVSASPRFDSAGTFIGSSYVYATARDFARFGYLYLHGGVWAGRRVLSESWVDTTRDMHAVDPENGHGYSWHWWCWNADPRTIAALGYEGQRTIVDRDRELVVVHLGKWVAETQPILDGHLSSIIAAFPRR